MRTSRLAMTTVLAAGLVGLAGSPALATGTDDLNCDDFDSQAAAQAEYDSDTSDPNQLDADDDGEACENTDYPSDGGDDPSPSPTETTTPGTGESTTGGTGGMEMPSGGVDAGAGGAAGDVSGLLASGGLLAAAGAGGLVLLRRRSAA